MKIAALAAAFLATSAGVALAEEGQPIRAADRIRADVSYLADDLLEGRDAGTRGYDLAAAFVASRFSALGFQPANGGGYCQQVPFLLVTLKKDAANKITIGGQEFANGEEVVLSGTSLFPDQVREAEVVFVGYGFENKKYGFDDYTGLDVRGKVVAVLGSLPSGAPSDVVADLADNRAELAEAKGAIGMITIPTAETFKQMPWDARRQHQ